jgi:long-chain fatty acid transport protein
MSKFWANCPNEKQNGCHFKTIGFGFSNGIGFACPKTSGMHYFAEIIGLRTITRQIIKLLAANLAVSFVLKASANGFALPDQDAFATARGEAVVATADNPSAIYYNPAGITQLEGHNLRLGLYALDYHTSFRPPAGKPNAGSTYYEEDNFAAIPRFFYAYSPTNCPLSFGLGVYSPFGGKMSWPDDTGFYSVATSGKLTYITINPVVAWKISESLSIAAGPMVNYVDLETDQGLRQFPTPANFFRFKGNGWSAGANVGVRWQPLDELAFGATLRSPAKVTLDGQTEFERLYAIPSSSRSANMELTFPLSVASGISWRPTPKWNLEFDASYTDWTSFGSTTIHQSNPPFPLQPNVPVNFDWQASWMYEFGVTRYFSHGWNASAGYCFSENSVRNSFYSPLVADMDRHFFSVGTGWKGKRLSFDVAYQFGYGPTHTVTGSQPPSAPTAATTGQNGDGKYHFYSSALSVSLGWHF